MANITAALVKELRERTQAGMMDCKKALMENDGDMDKAIDWLREKGLAQAAKKAGRIAAEGAVVQYITECGKVGADGLHIVFQHNDGLVHLCLRLVEDFLARHKFDLLVWG